MIQNLKTKIKKIFFCQSNQYPTPQSKREDVLSEHDKLSHGEQIMTNCLKVDASLKTLYKALSYDEDHVEGFCNDYLWMIQDAIDINWKTHVVGEDVSRDEFHRILNNKK